MTPQDTERIKQAAKEAYPVVLVMPKTFPPIGTDVNEDKRNDYTRSRILEAQHWAPIVEVKNITIQSLRGIAQRSLSMIYDRDKIVADRDKIITSQQAAIKELVEFLEEAKNHPLFTENRKSGYEQLIAKHK